MEAPEPTSETLPEMPQEPLAVDAPAVDLAALNADSTTQIGAAVEETLDAVDRELAGLEAALEGELEPVTAPSTSAPESLEPLPAVSSENSEASLEPIDFVGETAEIAESERAPADIFSEADTADVTEPQAQTPLDDSDPDASEELAATDPVAAPHKELSVVEPTVAVEEVIATQTAETPPDADQAVGAETPVTAELPGAATQTSEPSNPETPEPQSSETLPPKFARLRRALSAPFRAVLATLIVMDWPFARINPRLKHLLGCVGIATSVVAAATWLAADRLRH